MSTRRIHEAVESSRHASDPAGDALNPINEEVASPKSPTPPLTPAASSLKPESEEKGLTSRTQQSLMNVMQFISALSQQSAKTPAMPLDALLDDLGYKRDVDDDDESTGDSSSSFSFNMDTSSNQSFMAGHSTVTSLVRELRRAANSLARFSSDLAHRCVVSTTTDAGAETGARRRRRNQEDEESALVPWVGPATIMFVDLSGYSKIAAHLTNNGGAHALSQAVNAYFETILTVVVEQYGGEVLSFAGDAIVACWPCVAPRLPQESGLLAAACALDLQRKCGMSPVPGTTLAFRLHIGITHGEIESQILTSKTAASMQGAYQYVSGRPLEETVVVDCAGEGQVCITEDAFSVCGSYLEATPISAMPQSRHDGSEAQTPLLGASKRVFLLNSIDDDYQQFLEKGKPIEPVTRVPQLEMKLVPPSVAKKLRQGFKASHMAEMRNLCVLFIKKRHHNVNVAEWFAEVQSILDECRCPIVQILDDDKGTHLIAAVNLYQTERDPANVAITAASRLVNRETGCAIGVAYGEVFCGITGSDAACRWDITGPAVVRACRLMQHAETKGVEAIIDDSVHKVAVDISQLEELPEKIDLKGALAPVTVYHLLPSAIAVTSGIQSMSWASMRLHSAAREQLFTEMFDTKIQRGMCIVKGPIGAGKRTMLTLALERAKIRFFVVQCTRDQKPLSVVAALAEWYTYHEDEALAATARAVHKSFHDGKLTKTLESAHRLVNMIIALGIRACVVVAYAHFLDDASLAFLKAIVTTRPTAGEGRFLFAATLYYVHGVRPILQVAEGIKRALATNERFASPLVQTKPVHVFINYPTTTAEFGEALAGLTYFQMREHSLQILLEATGGCLALLPAIVEVIHAERGHKDGHFATTIDGTIHITSKGEDYLMTEIYWPRVAPDVTMRFMELYDALPARLQLILRCTATMSTTTGSSGIEGLRLIMAKLNSKITPDIVDRDVKTLKSYFILKDYGRPGGGRILLHGARHDGSDDEPSDAGPGQASEAPRSQPRSGVLHERRRAKVHSHRPLAGVPDVRGARCPRCRSSRRLHQVLA
jgi:class 3 adenylate cyclase